MTGGSRRRAPSRAWEGGGEYNVARGLKRCFGLRTGVVTALADNPVGRLIEDLDLPGRRRPDLPLWRAYDGVGRSVRNGLNFTERGFGVRGAVGCSDRGHSAASQMRAGDVDWASIFGARASAGSTPAASSAPCRRRLPTLAAEAIAAARRARHDRVVRPQLPSLALEGARRTRARQPEVNRELVENVDVLIGNEEDYAAALGYEVESGDENLLDLDVGGVRAPARARRRRSPAARARRAPPCARRERRPQRLERRLPDAPRVLRRPSLRGLEIFDRVGGGDSFASGSSTASCRASTSSTALDYGVAHGALAMTTPATRRWPRWRRSSGSSPAAPRESSASPRTVRMEIDPSLLCRVGGRLLEGPYWAAEARELRFVDIRLGNCSV